MPDLATVEGVELAAVGSHDCLTGTWNCTPQDIQDAVAAAAEPDWRAPVIKLGHTDPRFDGQPAVGTIRNLRASSDGTRLIGDLTDMPAWLADVVHAAYPSRSVEGIKKDIAASGRAYSFRLTALALLGVEPPAIESLADVARLYQVAASTSQQAAGYGTPVVTAPISAPVAASAAPSTNREEAGMPDMTPEQLREAIGLAADAPPMAVEAKLAVLGLIPKAAEPAAPAVEPKAVEPSKTETVTPDAPVVSLEMFQALKESHDTLAQRLADRDAADATRERDTFLADAVAAGRLKPADRDHFAKLFDADADTTRTIILARARGSELPVTPAGHAASPEGDLTDPLFAAFEAAIPDPDKKG